MHDEQTPRGPGRPRVYDKATEKVDAFRKRLELAGFLRKEVLVRTEVWQEIHVLAKQQGVSVVDAASGLLEHGLQAFLQQAHELQRTRDEDRQIPQIQSEVSSVGRQAFPDRTSPKDGFMVNPITSFLKKRRASVNDEKN